MQWVLYPTGQGSVIDVDDATGKDNGAVCLAHSGWAAPAFDRPIWEKISIDPFYGDPDNFPNSKPVVLAFNDWLAVADYSQNKELAAEWLKLAFTKEANNKWNETMGLIPARNDSQYGYVTESPQLKTEAELAAQYGVGFAGIKESAKLSTIMQDALGKLITEELTVEQALAKIQEEYIAALQVILVHSMSWRGVCPSNFLFISSRRIFRCPKILISMYWSPRLSRWYSSSSAVIASAAVARWIARMRGATRKQQTSIFAGYLFAAPWIVGFLIFVVVPLGFSLYWSFTDYRVTANQPAQWLGLENYLELILKDDSFRASIVNTLYLTVIGLPLQMAVALIPGGYAEPEVAGRTRLPHGVLPAGDPGI